MEVDKWLPGETVKEVYTSVFNVTVGNSKYSIFAVGYWTDPMIIRTLETILALRKLNDLDLYVSEDKIGRNKETKDRYCWSISLPLKLWCLFIDE